MTKEIVDYRQKNIDKVESLEKEKKESFTTWIRHILTILVGLANSINCQFILPIVRDKIPSDIDIEKYMILRLSKIINCFKNKKRTITLGIKLKIRMRLKNIDLFKGY